MKLKWSKKKPKIKDLKPCLILTRYCSGVGIYEYGCYEIKRIDCEGVWYWGLCMLDGDEWGDYNDFEPEEISIINY